MRYLAFIYVLLAAACLLSCKSKERAVVTVSEPVYIHSSDSVRTEYIERVRIDTVTVEILIPSETTREIVFDSVSHLETKFAESFAWINADGSLGHSLTNKEQKLLSDVAIPTIERESNNESVQIREIPVPYEVTITKEVARDFTKWESFRLKAFWYVSIGFILCVGLILKKTFRQ